MTFFTSVAGTSSASLAAYPNNPSLRLRTIDEAARINSVWLNNISFRVLLTVFEYHVTVCLMM